MFGRATPANESYRQGAAGGRKCVVVWYVTGSVGAESGWSLDFEETLKGWKKAGQWHVEVY